MDGICLSNLAGGQLEDAFQNALVRVLQNLSDVNTPYKPKREIDIKIVFEQNEERNDIKLGISVKPKLAAIIPVNTSLGMFRDLKTILEIKKYLAEQLNNWSDELKASNCSVSTNFTIIA